MLIQVKSKSHLKKAYDECSKEVQDYFKYIPRLLDDFPMEVCLAYVFSRLELGQRMALYCGVVKIHKVDSELARTAVENEHMGRDTFVKFYKTIFDFKLSKSAHDHLENAAKIRNMIMHGKKTTDDNIRNAIAEAIKFAEEVNKQLYENEKSQLKPFGNLRGFAGRLQKHDKGTSRFVLKGMGFEIE